MTWAVLREDVILRITRQGPATDIGALPKGVGFDRLRFDGKRLVDLADLETIYVRPSPGGYDLHVVAVPGSQPVTMRYAERKRLTMEGGTIRLMSEAEAEERQQAREQKNQVERLSAQFGGARGHLAVLYEAVRILLAQVDSAEAREMLARLDDATTKAKQKVEMKPIITEGQLNGKP